MQFRNAVISISINHWHRGYCNKWAILTNLFLLLGIKSCIVSLGLGSGLQPNPTQLCINECLKLLAVLGARVRGGRVINIRPVKPFETVPVLSGDTNTIVLN